jgi:enoyl-CoA hydratase/carnithine racemase
MGKRMSISDLDQDSAEVVRFERVGAHVARVTLNRPRVRNAVNEAMTQRLEECVRAVESEPTIRVAILAGAGDKAFCAGADLSVVAAGRGMTLMTPDGGFAGFVYAARSKPWIAAVHGFVLGGGLELSLACDMIVAADNAIIGLPEPKHGVLAGAGGVYRLARALPRAVALEMLTTGASIDARRAYELGLVNRVVQASRLAEETVAMAELIAANAPLSVREGLAIGRIAAERREEELQQLTAAAMARVLAGPDAVEGPLAFVEKRVPVWRS